MSDLIDVHALVDDELPQKDRAAVQELIKKNRAFQAEWYAVREIKEVVSTKCIAPNCEEVWKGSQQRIQQIERTKKVEFLVGRYAWGICGAFALIIIGAAAVNRATGGGLNTGDVVSASLTPLLAPKSQAPTEVKQWLQNNLGRAMPVPAGRISLLGGARGHLPDGRSISEEFLQDLQGRMKLIEVDQTDRVNGVHSVDGHEGYSGGTIDEINCVSWTADGKAFVLEGDRSVEALCQAADSLTTATIH